MSKISYSKVQGTRLGKMDEGKVGNRTRLYAGLDVSRIQPLFLVDGLAPDGISLIMLNSSACLLGTVYIV